MGQGSARMTFRPRSEPRGAAAMAVPVCAGSRFGGDLFSETNMNGIAEAAATTTGAAANWAPKTLTEWLVIAIVGAFLWMVKSQNDRILPALAEVTSAIRTLPAAPKDAVRDAVKESMQAADRHEHERAGRG